MSWLARSLVNSLRGEEEDEDENEEQKSSISQQNNREDKGGGGDDDPTRGVKEDLSELTTTLTRQFWSVASFLAPPPTSTGHPSPSDPSQASDPTASDDSSPRFGGIKSDFAEIGGRFKSMLSGTVSVSEISKFASTLLPFGEEEEEENENENGGRGGVVGVSDEVVAFARNISLHPETWLDFPLIADEDDFDEFDLSDAQQEHALAVERLAPRLAALRIELCPGHMSEGRLWKIYFVLLHPRLNGADAALLVTPQIARAREMLLEKLQNRIKPNSEGSGTDETPLPKEEMDPSLLPTKASTETSSSGTPTVDEPSTSIPIANVETETYEVEIIDKPVIEESPPLHASSTESNIDTIPVQKYEDDEDGDDEWLKEEEETGEAAGTANNIIPMGNEEDVSFSDLEEDDDQGTSRNSRTTTKGVASSNDKDSSDWLDVDIDFE